MSCCSLTIFEQSGAKQSAASVPSSAGLQPSAFSFSGSSAYTDADLSWLDECNCFRCESCEAIVALGFMQCPHCGGSLAGSLEPEPPAPRDRVLEPDNGFVCFGCGLLWRSGQDDGCPACGGILLPVRVREGLLS